MGRARDARVVVTNRLLALPGQLLVAEVQPTSDEPTQIVFDTGLVLRGRRHDPGRGDETFRVDGEPVEQHAARRFGGAMPGGGARRHVQIARRGGLVSLDQPQRLIHRVHHLDGADQDAAVRVCAFTLDPGQRADGERAVVPVAQPLTFTFPRCRAARAPAAARR